MPNEIRRLAFSYAETLSALRSYGERFQVKMPKGSLLHARFAAVDEEKEATGHQDHKALFKAYNVRQNRSNLVLTFYNDKDDSHTPYILTADFVTAALIQYCLGEDIMLPKSARKTLDITDFQLCLDMEMDIRTQGQETPLVFADED